MLRRLVFLGVSSILVSLSHFATLPPSHYAWAQVPHLIRYQGQAEDTNGVPLQGPYNLTFRFYNAETLGTVLWTETHNSVQLQGGHFSVLLGQVTPLNVDWGQPSWLSLQVNTTSELSPRQRISSVPLALRAETAENLATPPAMRSNVVTFSRTAVAGSGTQAVTGMGFQPKAVWVTCRDTAPNSFISSSAFADESEDSAGVFRYPNGILSNAAYLVDLWNGASDEMYSTLGTMNPDGFSIGWTKAGAGLNAACEAIGIR
jgi:hypothetical protein